jgi:hypothetical protein
MSWQFYYLEALPNEDRWQYLQTAQYDISWEGDAQTVLCLLKRAVSFLPCILVQNRDVVCSSPPPRLLS